MLHLRRAALLGAIVAFGFSISIALAQNGEVFGDKLGFVPVTNATAGTISGTGWVSATLEGNTLTVRGSFEGLSSSATAAHIHMAAPGQNGPVIIPLEVTNDTSGEITGNAELNEEQLQQLRDHHLYVMVHSEDNPGGELRAWLFDGYEPPSEGI